MTKYLVIKPDGEQSIAHTESLEDLQTIVGGYIELIVPIGNRIASNAIVFANEDGRILKLPFNPKASDIVGVALLGNVLICGPIDEDGMETDFHPGLVRTLVGGDWAGR